MHIGHLHDLGRGASIALVLVSFWLWWPLGFAMLAFLLFGRNRQGWCNAPGRWHAAWSQDESAQPRSASVSGSRGCWPGRRRPAGGNRAFDEYRRETLQRLEDEQREFVEYLERLRHARDKSEFDAFMSERRNQPPKPPQTAE